MRRVLFSTSLLLAASPVSAAEDRSRNEQVDRAIERGLEHLQITQDKIEGSWRDRANRPNHFTATLFLLHGGILSRLAQNRRARKPPAR